MKATENTTGQTKATVELKGVSKFYGEILGVNGVNLEFYPGITGVVGPNGAGKSTLMNLMAGLVRPNRGTVSICGITPSQPERFYRLVGYCTQYDQFPSGVTGRGFIKKSLRLHGYSESDSDELASRAIARVDMSDVADDSVESYSKGLRQRIRLAQSFCHNPKVLILDEPLNGLDPIARAQVNALFREFAAEGVSVIVSSHVLNEVDLMSDQVVLIDGGYLLAEGDAAGIRAETGEPMKIFIRSVNASNIAAVVFDFEHVIEAQLHRDRLGLFIQTTNADAFFSVFNESVLSKGWTIDAIGPADEAVEAVYRHLIVQDKVAS
ncbi:MAG: ABC transporter ATP-binding protein [Kangiellaceae bacterium]|jgi:ABC-2 type transport system ATP-binding protein